MTLATNTYRGQFSPKLIIKVLDPSCKHFYPCFRFQGYASTAVEHWRRAEENRSTRIAEATSTLRDDGAVGTDLNKAPHIYYDLTSLRLPLDPRRGCTPSAEMAADTAAR